MGARPCAITPSFSFLLVKLGFLYLAAGDAQLILDSSCYLISLPALPYEYPHAFQPSKYLVLFCATASVTPGMPPSANPAS